MPSHAASSVSHAAPSLAVRCVPQTISQMLSPTHATGPSLPMESPSFVRPPSVLQPQPASTPSASVPASRRIMGVPHDSLDILEDDAPITPVAAVRHGTARL